MKKDAPLYGSFLALFGAVLFSTKAIIVKLAYQYDIDSASLLMLRMLFALPFFIVIAGLSIKKQPKALQSLEKPWLLVLMGIMGYYLASLFDLAGLQYVDAGLERIILFTYPTIVLLLSYFWLKEKITIQQVLAILITFIGIGIAFTGNVSIHDTNDTLKGTGLVLLAALTYAIYLVGSQKIVAQISSKLYNSLAMIIASFAILIHNSLINGWNLLNFAAPVYAYAFLMSVLSTIIPSFMIVEGIRIIGAKKSSIIGTIGPICTIVLAAVFLGETVNATQWIGTLVVIGGILFLMLKKK